jgi:hypothetical protein
MLDTVRDPKVMTKPDPDRNKIISEIETEGGNSFHAYCREDQAAFTRTAIQYYSALIHYCNRYQHTNGMIPA